MGREGSRAWTGRLISEAAWMGLMFHSQLVPGLYAVYKHQYL